MIFKFLFPVIGVVAVRMIRCRWLRTSDPNIVIILGVKLIPSAPLLVRWLMVWGVMAVMQRRVGMTGLETFNTKFKTIIAHRVV